MSPSKLVYLFLLIVATGVAGFIAFIWADAPQAIWVVKNFGYWLMLLNFVAVLYLLKLVVGLPRLASVVEGLRSRALSVLFLAVFALVLQLLQPHGYKIIMDEPSLASTSLRMHEYKEVMTTARTHEINGVFRQLDGFVDKRPFFFPFIVSLAHDVLGYSSDNPIIVNGILSFLLLGMLFYTGEQCWPKYGGYFSVCLFSTLPLLSMSMTGAGFGILNLLMILVTAQAAMVYLRAPNVSSMNLLIYFGLLLAQTRYESVVFVLPITLIVFLGWVKKKEIQLNWLTVCAPFLLVPYGLQRVIYDNSSHAYELREGASVAFSLSYISENLIEAADFFFNVSTNEYPNSLLLSAAFVIATIAFIYHLMKHRLKVDGMKSEQVVFLSFSAVVIFNFFLLMSYHWGQLNDIMATRIALPFIMFQVFFCVLVGRIFIKKRAVRAVCFCVIGCFFMGFTIPSAAKNDYLQWVPGRHETAWVQAQSERLYGSNVLVISNRHLASIIERVPSIAQFWAKNNKSKLKLHLDLGTYEAIYIIHMMVEDPNSERGMIPATPVYHDYDLELITEEKLGDRRYIRMSRIVDVNLIGAERDLLEVIKKMPKTPHEKLAFVAETLP